MRMPIRNLFRLFNWPSLIFVPVLCWSTMRSEDKSIARSEPPTENPGIRWQRSSRVAPLIHCLAEEFVSIHLWRQPLKLRQQRATSSSQIRGVLLEAAQSNELARSIEIAAGPMALADSFTIQIRFWLGQKEAKHGAHQSVSASDVGSNQCDVCRIGWLGVRECQG